MLRTRIKICGITRAEDAREAVNCGVDALGFNFCTRSARHVAPETAREIARDLPPLVTRVGLFVDEQEADLAARLDIWQPDLLQFHGSETPACCDRAGLPYVKALAAGPDIARVASAYKNACAILLDSDSGGQFGGTGQTFDWNLVPTLSRPLILAGGLDADNVGEAILRLRPFAVDVSSGVEVEKGIKDPAKMKAFVEAVHKADGEKA